MRFGATHIGGGSGWRMIAGCIICAAILCETACKRNAPPDVENKPMKVEFDIFSGRPNPSWELTAAQNEEFRKRLRALPRNQSASPASNDDRLGYRGMIVTTADGDAVSADRIVVSAGTVSETGAQGSQTFSDSGREFERWLLSTGRSILDPDLYDEAFNQLRTQNQPTQEKNKGGNVKIEDVQERHEQRLMAIPGVTGVGITLLNGQPAILIMVNQLTPELKKKLPDQLEGYAVKIEVSGELRAQ